MRPPCDSCRPTSRPGRSRGWHWFPATAVVIRSGLAVMGVNPVEELR